MKGGHGRRDADTRSVPGSVASGFTRAHRDTACGRTSPRTRERRADYNTCMDGSAAAPSAGKLATSLDAALPQTQCRRCGYAGCLPYAQAIVEGAAINRCPPGGIATIEALAVLTGRPVVALDQQLGPSAALEVAAIDEATCIGCTLCIAACPVDAIVGGPKSLHTVLPDWCTGCGLCLPPCPVDCIVMHPADRDWTTDDAARARARHNSRGLRLAAPGRAMQPAKATLPSQPAPLSLTAEERRAVVAAAIARARMRRVRAVSQ